MTSAPQPIQTEGLNFDHIAHGFFTRLGGISEGIYAGLNVGLGSDDERERVVENRKRVGGWFGQPDSKLNTVFQIHSDVVCILEESLSGEPPKADAIVTNQPNMVIGVLTADCGPVLFADGENGVIGAAHAGWKGATGGILDNTIWEMEKLGATRSNIVAVLGPTISQPSYEVGPEFVDRLINLDPANKAYLSQSQNAGHAQFDLPGYIVDRLGKLGVQASWTGQCTYLDEDRFFSYRRTTHRKEPDYGRQVSAIALKSD